MNEPCVDPACGGQMTVTDRHAVGGTGAVGGRIPITGHRVLAACPTCGQTWVRSDFERDWRPFDG